MGSNGVKWAHVRSIQSCKNTKKAFVWLWKSNSERISLDKRRKQKLTLGKQIIQKRNNSILNKKCSWIEPLDTLVRDKLSLLDFSQTVWAKFSSTKSPVWTDERGWKAKGIRKDQLVCTRLSLLCIVQWLKEVTYMVSCKVGCVFSMIAVSKTPSCRVRTKWPSGRRTPLYKWSFISRDTWPSTICPWFDLFLSYIKKDYLSTRLSILEIRTINY